MAHRRAALESLRSDRKKHLRNRRVKLDLKKEFKRFEVLLASNKKDETRAALKKIISKLDKAVTKGVIRKNTASRKKSFLAKRFYRASGITLPPTSPSEVLGPSAPS